MSHHTSMQENTMRLDQSQLDQFRHDGYLVFPNLLSPDEVAALDADVPMLQSDRRRHADANVYTTAGGIRSSYSPRLDSRAFEALVRIDRILEPIRQLLDGEVYLYQSRLNAKPRGDQGAAWQWHQDFPSWYHDGIPAPRLATALIFVSDVTQDNAPLTIIPRGHRQQEDYFYETEQTGYALHSLTPDALDKLTTEHPPVPLTGAAGTVVFFDCLLPHCSGASRTDSPRNLMFQVYNRDDNRPASNQWRRPHRSPWLLEHDTPVLASVSGQALNALAPAA